MSKSIIVFCPNPSSLYTASICEMLIQKGYTIDHIVVRKFTIDRFKAEFSRDGKRLLKKIWNKLVLKQAAYKKGPDNIISFREKHGLKKTHVKDFIISGTKLEYCDSLNDSNVEKVLKQYQDKIVVFTGGGIIRKNILDLAGDGIINCHMGILPRYRGMDLPEWCLLENRTDDLGITLHFMDSGIDTGDILKKVSVDRGNHTNIKDLRNSFEGIMVNAMVEVVDDYINKRITPEKQEESNRRQYFMVHPRLYELIDEKLAVSN